jgi:hypothetical protein
MAQYHSTGVSKITAIMAAHRAASAGAGASTVYCQEEIERIQVYLRTVETEQAADAASRRRPQTNAATDKADHLEGCQWRRKSAHKRRRLKIRH